MVNQESILQLLNQLKIPHSRITHPPVYTIEEMLALGMHGQAEIAKNLFLRDAKGRRFFLVMLCGGKTADLTRLREQLGTSRLSFASEQQLARYLGLSRGSVTPFGLLNDESRTVEAVFDRALTGLERVGVHPNVNTSTVFLPFSGVEAVTRFHGNAVSYVTV